MENQHLLVFCSMGLWAQLQQEVQNGKQHTEKMAMFKGKKCFRAANLDTLKLGYSGMQHLSKDYHLLNIKEFHNSFSMFLIRLK